MLVSPGIHTASMKGMATGQHIMRRTHIFLVGFVHAFEANHAFHGAVYGAIVVVVLVVVVVVVKHNGK
jgi:hypothetical protein